MVATTPYDLVTVKVQLSGPNLQQTIIHTLRLESKSKLSELGQVVRPLLGK
jgi:hypothetical protein